MRTVIAAAALLIAAAHPAVAGSKARFLGDGTYATAEGCAKLAALAAGTPRNLNSVPETLDADGYHGWEHDCHFTSIKEVRKGRSWRVGTSCTEGPERWRTVEAFARRDDGGFTVTTTKTKTEFVRCAGAKGK